MIQYQPFAPDGFGGDPAYPRLVEPDAEPRRLRLVGDDLEAPLVTGESRRHVNLDYAASTPPLVEVWETVQRLLPYYSSVHRGAGYKSQVSTVAYEQARTTIGAFFGARPDDTLIFTRHTTDALNLLAACLPPGARVLTTAVEHHANLLPWRRAAVDYLPVPASPADLLRSLEEWLAQAGGAITLVAVTGASNVTGEIWPLAEIARITHRYGARLVVDAAQLAPHAPIDITFLEIDYLAMSGHKLYAPFGIGVLIGRGDWLAQAEPVIQGGGAVESVSLDEVTWRGLPERHEAGTPNLIGAVALAAACRALRAFGMDRLAAEEADLYAYAWKRLSSIACLELYTVWDHTYPHIGVLSFNLDGYPHGKLATILSAEYGISVRSGSFCAHPLVQHLIRGGNQNPDPVRCGARVPVTGAVRLSMGLGATRQDIDYVADALGGITERGPRWRYRQCPTTGEHQPDPDTRVWPALD